VKCFQDSNPSLVRSMSGQSGPGLCPTVAFSIFYADEVELSEVLDLAQGFCIHLGMEILLAGVKP